MRPNLKNAVKTVIRTIPAKNKIAKLIMRMVPRRTLAPMPDAEKYLGAVSARPVSIYTIPPKAKSITCSLSVIVPAYNVERYIGKCLDSITTQSFSKTFEVIVVNDGSTDGTLGIVQDHMHRDSRIRLIDQMNNGLSGARNSGMDAARGEYITFVDSDDYLPPHALQTMFDTLEERSVDFVTGQYLRVSENNDAVEPVTCPPRSHGAPWGRMYRRAVWNDIRFPERYWFEDTIQAFLIDSSYSNIEIKDCVYCYRKQSGSISQNLDNPKVLDAYWIIREMVDWISAMGRHVDQSVYDCIIEHMGALLYSRINKGVGESTLKEVFLACGNFLNNDRRLLNMRTKLPGLYRDVEDALRNRQYKRWKVASLLLEVVAL